MSEKFIKAKDADEVIKFAKSNNIQFVDFKFTDLLGTWQHVTTSAREAYERCIPDGIPFDGSSIRGWKTIDTSDMLAKADFSTAMIDPFNEIPTLSLIVSIFDPITKEKYDRDPRSIAENAVAYLNSTGIGDTAVFAPEAEFFIFDDVRFDLSSNGCFYKVDSSEGIWNTGSEEFPNLGYKLRHKEGYFPVPPSDSLQNLRNEICAVMEELGLKIERHHHEVATAGQNEINFVFDTMVSTGDNLQLYKYVIRNVCKKHGKTATFMPKPLFGDNGSGMHTHQSIWKGGKPTFAGDKYAGLSDTALYYIGGLLKHAKALTAICNPTTNSFKRLVPGYEAPVNFAYSARNRSAAIRIPVTDSPKAKRVEFRTPDGSCCIYLALAAQLLAGIDGIKNKIHPGDPLDKNLYELAPEEIAKVPHAPDSLKGAVEALQVDYDFLLAGGVFTKDLIDVLIDFRIKDYDELRLRPHPLEFFKYYDC